jgi:hypothetical protein
MARLVDVEHSCGVIHKTYAHIGDDGKKKITVASSQDTAPQMQRAKRLKQTEKGKDFRFKASLPSNLINDACYSAATVWGVTPQEVMVEIMAGKTDRSQKLVKTLTEGRDFRKFQAQNY